MQTTDDKLTVAEETLRDLMAVIAADRAGGIARAHGWPEPDQTQLVAMTRLILRAYTDLVLGMRRPDARPPSREEIDQVLGGVALGVLEHVMGPPIPDVVH